MTLTSLIVSLLLAAPFVHASEPAGFARVIAIAPSATFDGKKVSEDSMLAKEGILKTNADGGAKISFPATNSVVEIAASSEVKIVAPTIGVVGQQIELMSGMARARVTKPAETKVTEKPVFTLRAKAGTMGVRGTDFIGIANPALGEAEVIVFEGKVEFTSTSDLQDARMIQSGYWGGIGGRFGAKTVNPIKLSKDAIDYFDKLSRGTPAFSVKPAADGKKTESGHGG